MSEVHTHTIELLLKSISTAVGDDGLRHDFFFFQPGTPKIGLGHAGVEIFHSKKRLTLAALYVRRHGPAYLRAMAISDINRLLTSFVSDNYWYIAEDTFGNGSAASFETLVSTGTKAKLATLLETSSIFVPTNELLLFPLVPVVVEADFSSPAFFFRKPETLANEVGPPLTGLIDGAFFPPYKDTKAKRQIAESWLGVRAPIEQAAKKTRAAVLGAAALTLTENYRYMFSGREMFGGIATIKSTYGFQFGRAHTPPVMHDLRIRDLDHAWLSTLAQKVSSDDPVDQRHLRALEYFYRAWPLSPPERYPLHCMALEAIYSQKGKTTQSVKDGVRATLGAHIPADRIGDLLKVRGAVIHGQAPDVYDAEEYDAYYNTYSADPVRDLAALTAAALRQHLFGATMIDQVEPHLDIVAKATAQGKLPKKLGDPHSILAMPPTP
ncbi:MAG: hypothetical protein KF779_10300 [Hyphomonadaceae bacterium]|nr:hypothetical protein [Hyphomonadaceae bacterium]